MNFIKKLFEKKEDELVHLQFQKFSKGEFRDKALIEAKKSGKGWTIKTSSEFANEFVREVAEKLGPEKARVTGAIVSTQDLEGIEFKDKKQFQGVKRYLIDREMTGNEIIKMVEGLPKNFFALSFEVPGGTKLKIKPKAPKSGKPGKEKEGGPKADFCNLKTSDENIAREFIFEKPNFKEAKIKHTFFIDELVLPDGEKDYAKMRELAKRKGRIVREAVIDGQKMKKEIEFEA